MSDPGCSEIRVLSIDGGGIRGLIPAMVLASIERQTGRRVRDLFDYVAGTSTGGLLAIALSQGVPAEELVTLYEQAEASIFARTWGHRIRTLWGLLGPKYSPVALEDWLRKHLSVVSPYTCPKTLVTAYDIAARRPVVFKSWQGVHDDIMICLATAAAPTYFPAVRDDARLLVDGGVFAGNPAMCAVADVLRNEPGRPIRLLSLGTGRHEDGLTGASRGLLGWARPITDVLLDGGQEAVEYQVRHHPAVTAYLRLQTDLPPAARPMDAADVGALRQVGLRLLLDRHADLAAFAALLARTERWCSP